MKSKLVMFLVVLFVAAGAVQAADSLALVVYNATQGMVVDPGGVIYINDESDNPQSYEIQIYIENDSKLGGISLPFMISSPDGATWTLDDVTTTFAGAIPNGGKFISGVAGSRWMSGNHADGSCWDLTGTLISDGLAPAQFLIGGASLSGGLTTGPMQHMLSVHFTPGGVAQGENAKQLVIDTAKYPPAGDFVFQPEVGGTLVPKFSGEASYSVSFYPVDANDVNPGISYSFDLDQNHPNPFNPSTTVEYSLARKSHVNISVYNILGQKVITLVNGEQEAGPHHAVWEGRDGNGSQVASGIYFYKMVAGDFVQTRKMALMR